jgi:catechol 2,3-dioxygenase-like lactoylglutathione lyase family enzyme
MPIDHTSIAVSDYEAAKAFFGAALKPLEYKLVMEVPGPACGFGAPCGLRQVDEWYQAAMAAGAEDNGAPGLRQEYHQHYYGAFVKDPVDGNNIEAVCHKPE